MEVLQGVQHCVVSITRAHNYGRYCRACVYFDRNVKSMFYVDYKPSQEIISGKGKKNMKFQDFKVTNYRMPMALFYCGI
jgi:hypothetical protein